MPLTVQPGTTFEADALYLPPSLEGTIGVQIKDKPAGGDVVVARTTAGITEEPAGSGHYGTELVAPDDGGQYWIFWDSGVDTAPFASEELVVSYTAPEAVTGPTFATALDVSARLGRELTEAETAQVEFLLAAATEIITMSVGKDAEWATSLDVPTILRYICADMVARALTFTAGVNSTTESLGQYSYTERGDGESYGLWMTDMERMMARRVVNGSLSGSARTESIATDVWPEPVIP